jgi:hypothetical protein
MQYMLLIHLEEGVWDQFSDAEHQQMLGEYMEIIDGLQAKGEYISASPLHPASATTTVKIREGRQLVTDGPFAETREQLGGYFLIDVGDLDDALAVAKRLPGARYGTVEVRPLMNIEQHFGLPEPGGAPGAGDQESMR